MAICFVNHNVPACYKTMYRYDNSPKEMLQMKQQIILTPKEEENLKAVIEATFDDVFKNWK